VVLFFDFLSVAAHLFDFLPFEDHAFGLFLELFDDQELGPFFDFLEDQEPELSFPFLLFGDHSFAIFPFEDFEVHGFFFSFLPLVGPLLTDEASWDQALEICFGWLPFVDFFLDFLPFEELFLDSLDSQDLEPFFDFLEDHQAGFFSPLSLFADHALAFFFEDLKDHEFFSPFLLFGDHPFRLLPDPFFEFFLLFLPFELQTSDPDLGDFFDDQLSIFFVFDQTECLLDWLDWLPCHLSDDLILLSHVLDDFSFDHGASLLSPDHAST
jgi:hypothetical protein